MAALLAMTTGCSAPITGPTGSGSTIAVLPGTRGVTRIEVVIGDRVATASLEPTAATTQLLSQLPLTVALRDHFGQAASWLLPGRLEVAGAHLTRYWVVGEVAYDPDSSALAIFHAHDTEGLGEPGVVRLGVVTSGLEVIADAGPGATALVRVAG